MPDIVKKDVWRLPIHFWGGFWPRSLTLVSAWPVSRRARCCCEEKCNCNCNYFLQIFLSGFWPGKPQLNIFLECRKNCWLDFTTISLKIMGGGGSVVQNFFTHLSPLHTSEKTMIRHDFEFEWKWSCWIKNNHSMKYKQRHTFLFPPPD